MRHKLTFFLILALAALFTSHAFAGIQIFVNVAPPPIAVFDQPPCPGDGYIWIPGYYQYGDYGYYWVSGHWVMPPSVGVLWTPGYWGFAGGRYLWHEGYWGFAGGRYLWHEGYWGPTVGFYGGVNYGNGYFGAGFTGGRWEGNMFRPNTGVTNIDRNNVSGWGPSYNGKGGSQAPSHEEESAARAPHQGPT